MASTSSDGHLSVRRTRSANDVDSVSARHSPASSSLGGGAVAEGPSGAAVLGKSPVLASLTPPPSGLEELDGATSTPYILPPIKGSSETTLNENRSSTSNNLMEGSATTIHPTGGNEPVHPPAIAPNAAQQPQQPQHATIGQRISSFVAFLGFGNRASERRRSQASMAGTFAWGFVQIATITTMVSLSGTVWKSPVMPGQTEWKACDRPLGIWACLWVGRVVLATGMAYWDYKRNQARAALQRPDDQTAAENGEPAGTPGTPPIDLFNPLQPPSNPYQNPTGTNSPNGTGPPANLPYTLLYSRLTLCSSLLTLSWFLTAHILEYTSLSTCRHTSPHLWWLIFGILCIMYIMILELLVMGFIILIVAPILFLFWNVFLFCIGRHPVQNPHMIKPDVGKLSKSVVDRLPLVMYIPPPPAPEAAPAGAPTTPESEPKEVDIAEVTSEHKYPPTPPQQLEQQQQEEAKVTSTKRSRRFRFFKRKVKPYEPEDEGTLSGGDDAEKGHSWEDQYEKGEHPFVILEGNRAACAICLMDFEPPRRKDEEAGGEAKAAPPTSPPATARSPQSGGSDPEQLRLEDSEEGAQPLRLLGCGHVFHRTCLDPWLTDVSGRCPVCQRKVQEQDLLKKKRRRRW